MGSTALRLLGFLSFPRGFQLGIRNRSRNWEANNIEIILQITSSSEKLFKSTWSEEGLGDVEVIPRLGGGLSPGLNHRPSFKCQYTIYGIMIIDDHSFDIYKYKYVPTNFFSF